MKPWKTPLNTNVDFYLKLADGMDLVYLSKLKKNLLITKHVTNKEIQLLKISSEIARKYGHSWQIIRGESFS